MISLARFIYLVSVDFTSSYLYIAVKLNGHHSMTHLADGIRVFRLVMLDKWPHDVAFVFVICFHSVYFNFVLHRPIMRIDCCPGTPFAVATVEHSRAGTPLPLDLCLAIFY